jgi:hypothetical protein
VALYALWSCRDVKSLGGGFAKTIGRIVEVQYARHDAASELCFRTEGALRKDLERGLGNPDHEQIANILHGLVWWRCLHQYPAEFDPTWPSMISSARRNIIMTVKEPAVLFGWIDAARARSRAGQ